jgi:glycyl-radical enzyme activating protein
MGKLFNIQKYSVNDGPGIRTLAFFKGCPLSCKWCSNPESQKMNPEIMFFNNLCKLCGACEVTCENNCISVEKDTRKYERSDCRVCGNCVTACPNRTIRIVGKDYSVEEIVSIAKKDYLFYFNSGGGVTIGGGEPTMQPEFLNSLLSELKKTGIHTAIETCGHFQWDTFEKSLPLLDLVLFDIKHMDPGIHKKFTGQSNHLILENLARLLNKELSVIIRIPLIPGFNDDPDVMAGICKFLEKHDNYGSVKWINLLPYHKLGVNKYKALDKEYDLNGLETPVESDIQALKAVISSYKYECKVEYI